MQRLESVSGSNNTDGLLQSKYLAVFINTNTVCNVDVRDQSCAVHGWDKMNQIAYDKLHCVAIVWSEQNAVSVELLETIRARPNHIFGFSIFWERNCWKDESRKQTVE